MIKGIIKLLSAIAIIVFCLVILTYTIDWLFKPQRINVLKPMNNIFITCKNGNCKTPDCPEGPFSTIYECLEGRTYDY